MMKIWKLQYLKPSCLVIDCLYDVVEGSISARYGSIIINRERVEADVKKL